MTTCRTVVVSLAAVGLIARARADAQDQPSSVVVYPYVTVDTTIGMDTVVQLTNVANQAVEARCFYEDFTLVCTGGTTGESCGPGPVTCSGVCANGYGRIPFPVRLTPHQPVLWRLSQGLSNGPIDGVNRVGPGGESNQGTAVPPLNSMVGTLRCVVAGAEEYQPGREDALVGLATIEQQQPPGISDAMQYRAIGLRAVGDGTSLNRDEFLQLGGAEGEYDSCPALLMLEHFFDDGPVRSGEQTPHVEPAVVLTTCTAPLTTPAGNVTQFLVYNEFDQRFSTSRSVLGQLVTRLATLDTTDPKRSIFSVGVAGTLAGHTIIRGVGSGLHAIGLESYRYADEHVRSAAYNVHGASARRDADFVAFRPPLCTGDCNQDGAVRVNELVSGVNIALDRAPVSRCELMDANHNAAVAVNELVLATNAAISGCPRSMVPTPTALAETAPGGPVGVGTEITVLGLTTADDRPLESNGTDGDGRPIFERPFGQGMTLVVEARGNQRPIGQTTYNESGMLPDLQVLVSNSIGDGGTAVCENDGRSGGVPGNAALDFTAAGAVDAVNDLGCRAYGRRANVANMAFTRLDGRDGVWSLIDTRSQVQFGIPIAKAWAFPIGDTIVAARVRDTSGELSPVREIVVRVAPL